MADSAQTPTCRTCRSWQTYGNPRDAAEMADCDKICHDSEATDDLQPQVSSDDWGILITPPDFGCTLHEENK